VRRRQFLVGFAICFVGAICFSSKAILVKLAYRVTSIDSVTLLTLRMVFSLPFFIPSALFLSGKKNNVKFTIRQWLKIAFVGCLGYYVSSLLDFIGLRFISAGMERLILFIYPTLVLLLSLIIYKSKINLKQWLAIALCYVGLVIAFSKELFLKENVNDDFYLGALAIFACAFTYAAYIVGSGRLIPLVGAAKFNSYAMSFAAFGVIIHFVVVTQVSLFNLPMQVYLYSALMAVIATVIPSYLVSEAIKRIGANNTAIISSIGPISTIFQAFIFLGEPVSFLQLVGTSFILTGVLLISFKGKIKTEPL
jgi:drug/metabolite transporter (DMT)-like permease